MSQSLIRRDFILPFYMMKVSPSGAETIVAALMLKSCQFTHRALPVATNRPRFVGIALQNVAEMD
jgi:hypothetical protein